MRFLKKNFIHFVTLALLFIVPASPLLAAAPTITSLDVSETSISVTFDQQVVSTDSQTTNPSARNLNNYTLTSPSGTSKILSARSPYNHLTDYNDAARRLRIYGLNLTQGQSANIAIQNIKNLSGETMSLYNATTTVSASADPRIDTIARASDTAPYAKSGENLTLTGVNFGTAGSITIENASSTVVSWSATSIAITLSAGLSGRTDPASITVYNSVADRFSRERPFALYDSTYGVLKGVLQDTDSAALNNIEVYAYQGTQSWNRYQTRTQTNGAFALTVPAGTYTVEAITPGSGTQGAAPAKSTGHVVSANAVTNAGTISFVAPTITGTVYDPNGTTPVYGALIRARNDTWTIEKQAVSASNGAYKVFVPVASTLYTLEVTPSDYDRDVREYLSMSATSIAGSPAVQTNITLGTKNVTGTVKTPSGSATSDNPFPDSTVQSANVHLFRSNWTFDRWASTDSSGNFSFSGVPNGTDYILEIEAPWCGDQNSEIAKLCVYPRTRFENVQISGITNLNQSSQAAGGALRFTTPNFFGYVYADANSNNSYDFTDTNTNSKCDAGETGEGVQGAWVSMSKEGGYWTGAQTGACGRYAFALPGTGRYFFDVQPNNSAYASISEEITVDALPLTAPRNVKLTAPNVTGFIYGPSASADASAGQSSTWIDMCPQGTPGRCYGGGGDQNGAFSINVPDGTWNLQVHPGWNSFYVAPSPYTVVIASGAVASVNSDTSDTDEPFRNDGKIIVRLIDPANDPNGFVGTVYDPTGVTAQTNVGVGLRPAEADGASCIGVFTGNSRWTQTNSLGKFAFGDISAGLYEIEVTPWGSSAYSRTRVCWNTATQGRNASINLTTPNITGIIKTPAGSATNDNPTPNTAVQSAWVSLFQEGGFGPSGNWFGGNTNEQGQFSLGGVAAGTYTLEIHPSWGSAYSMKRFPGITITATGNCTTVTGGDQDSNANACDLNTLTGVGDGTAVRLGLPQLKGQIVDPDNNPVRYTWVMVHDQFWSSNAGGETDESGNFKLGGLADGTYQIEINLPWGTSQALVAPSGLAVQISGGQGTVTQGGTALTNNKIQLQTPQKTLTGRVFKDANANNAYDSGEEVVGARVEAHKDMGGGFFETKTNTTGSYTLKLSGGAWWIEVRPDWSNESADWVYTDPPKRVVFNDDNTTESKTENFIVAAANATITGTIKTPTGSTVQYAWVDIRGKGMGNSTSTDSQGRFSIRVPAGTYKIHVFPNTDQYGAPDGKTVTVAANETVDAGTLTLKARNATIKGFATDDTGNAVRNVVINAWQFEGSGWANAYTDQTGAYTLTVSSGTWGIMAMPMSQNYVIQGPAKKIEIKENETLNGNNFTLKIANKTLKVKVKDTSGNRITNVWGGVWVRDTSQGSMLDFGGPMQDMMEKSGMLKSGGGAAVSTATAGGASGSPLGPGMEQGGFAGGGLVNGYTEIKVPAGTYEVGLGMPPGSAYTLQATKAVTFADTDTTKDVDLVVLSNNATISGQFYQDANNNNQVDTGEAIAGTRAFIHADKSGGGWQFTESASDGSYTLRVSEGTWYLDAFIDPFMFFSSKQYMVVNEDAKLTVAENSTSTYNFKVKELDATITGTVKNPNGVAMTEGLVWVFADYGSAATTEDFEGPGGPGLGTFSDTDGTYTLKVPAGTYKIGAGIPPWETRDLLNPDSVTVTVGARQTSTGNHLQFKQSDATLTGNITFSGTKKASFVRAWSDNGRGAGTISLDGTYRLSITQNDTWHIQAATEIADTYYESEEATVTTVTGTASYTQNLTLVSRNITVPDGVTATFDASEEKTVRLSKLVNGVPKDEVVMEIPAGAIETSGTITVSITPTVNTKPDAKDKPIGLGYDFEARKSDGTEVESFIQNVTIYIYYDETLIRQAGYAEESITPKYFDERTGSWENYDTIIRDTVNNVLIIKTDHFSVGQVTGSGAIPNAPTGFTATVQGSSSVALAWTDNSVDESGFKVFRGSTLITTTAANAVSHTDTGLSAGTYTYQVKATNASGDSAPATASVTITAGSTVSSGSPSGTLTAPPGGGSSPSNLVINQDEKKTKAEASKDKPIIKEEASSMQKQQLKAGADQIQRIVDEAKKLLSGKVTDLLAFVGAKRDIAKEQKVDKGLAAKIIGKLKVSLETRRALTNFITYGTPETIQLGEGERAGVADSFRDAFGRVPANEKDWGNVLKIAVGRWPDERSETKEKQAEETFKLVYGHSPNRKDPKEDAAVTIMAYGLRPGTRSTTNERAAILSYRATFKSDPKDAKAWNTVRAIAYSGAKKASAQKAQPKVAGARVKVKSE